MKLQIRLLGAAALMLGNTFGGSAWAAGGYTNTVVPTNLEIVQSSGFTIFGLFGNPGPNPCPVSNRIWVSVTHPQYKEILSTAMTALAAGLKLRAYVHTCTVVGWYGLSFNELIGGGSLDLSR